MSDRFAVRSQMAYCHFESSEIYMVLSDKKSNDKFLLRSFKEVESRLTSDSP